MDQVVEHQGPLLDRPLVFDLVFDLDVIVIALIDPNEFTQGIIGIAELFADTPPLADVLKSRSLSRKG